MYAIVYQFTIKEGNQDEFEKYWAIVTESIKRARGGLGSVLHKTDVSTVYIAYAQWPSKEILEKDFDENIFTEDENAARTAMRGTTEKIETLYKLEIVDDKLIR
jgi:heme-degrading monooxygenase HmoA